MNSRLNINLIEDYLRSNNKTNNEPNMHITNHDLTGNDHKYLKEIEFLASLKFTSEQEIQHYLDCIQSSPEEKQSLHDLYIEHLPDSHHHTEWVNEEINIGSGEDYDNYEYYTQLLDKAEMDADMDAFEEENTCHELFANNPWETRDYEASATKVSKRSGFHAWAEVSHIGGNYATGETDYGKVYIPIHFVHQLGINEKQLLFMCMTFKGFGETRSCTMPWRCSFINMTS